MALSVTKQDLFEAINSLRQWLSDDMREAERRMRNEREQLETRLTDRIDKAGSAIKEDLHHVNNVLEEHEAQIRTTKDTTERLFTRLYGHDQALSPLTQANENDRPVLTWGAIKSFTIAATALVALGKVLQIVGGKGWIAIQALFSALVRKD